MEATGEDISDLLRPQQMRWCIYRSCWSVLGIGRFGPSPCRSRCTSIPWWWRSPSETSNVSTETNITSNTHLHPCKHMRGCILMYTHELYYKINVFTGHVCFRAPEQHVPTHKIPKDVESIKVGHFTTSVHISTGNWLPQLVGVCKYRQDVI